VREASDARGEAKNPGKQLEAYGARSSLVRARTLFIQVLCIAPGYHGGNEGDGHVDVSASRPAGNLATMNKWRYALLGWIAWKLIKRRARKKIPLAG
jgi:hypothetical protein